MVLTLPTLDGDHSEGFLDDVALQNQLDELRNPPHELVLTQEELDEETSTGVTRHYRDLIAKVENPEEPNPNIKNINWDENPDVAFGRYMSEVVEVSYDRPVVATLTSNGCVNCSEQMSVINSLAGMEEFAGVDFIEFSNFTASPDQALPLTVVYYRGEFLGYYPGVIRSVQLVPMLTDLVSKAAESQEGFGFRKLNDEQQWKSLNVGDRLMIHGVAEMSEGYVIDVIDRKKGAYLITGPYGDLDNIAYLDWSFVQPAIEQNVAYIGEGVEMGADQRRAASIISEMAPKTIGRIPSQEYDALSETHGSTINKILSYFDGVETDEYDIAKSCSAVVLELEKISDFKVRAFILHVVMTKLLREDFESNYFAIPTFPEGAATISEDRMIVFKETMGAEVGAVNGLMSRLEPQGPAMASGVLVVMDSMPTQDKKVYLLMAAIINLDRNFSIAPSLEFQEDIEEIQREFKMWMEKLRLYREEQERQATPREPSHKV